MLLPLLAAILSATAPLAPAQVRDTVPVAKSDSAKKKGGHSVTLTVRDRDSGECAGLSTGSSDNDACKASRVAAKRIPVTPALIASAYATPATRALVLRAREARTAVDSTLRSYRATAYQRMSAGIALRALAPERLAARGEQSAKVWWDRDRGALVQINGARAVQMLDDDDKDDDRDPSSTETIGLPYVPGEDRLWPVGRWKVDVGDEEIIHPLAAGAEAYYTYSLGDSVGIRIPRGGEYHLIELRVNPRAARWNAVVGSLWLDRETAQIVRAAYRLASPLDLWIAIDEDDAHDRANGEKDDDIPGWIRSAFHPMRASLSAVTQEFALQGGHWWLPISRTAEGRVEVGSMRIPLSWEERFTYDDVSGAPLPGAALDSLATQYAARLPLADTAALAREGHVPGDSAWNAARRQLDSLQSAEKTACVESLKGTRTEITTRFGVRTFIVVPCDTAVLAHSPDLPPSIYESSDVVFGATDRDELRQWAMSIQAEGEEGKRPPPTILYGIGGGLTRYNRVEGLSLGVRAEQRLKRGYAAHAVARFGVADLHPGGEIGISHTNPIRTWDLTAYHRLAVAGDYGDPFTLGASLGALLFGRDDGFYFRATGAELTRTSNDRTVVQWRLFGEHEGDAPMKTNVSLAHLGNGRFAENILARRGDVAGLGVTVTRAFGDDPRGWRLLASTRGEAATGTFDYSRALADLTLSRPLPLGTEGALTGAAGLAGGDAPIQKLFFIGGPQTVRGIDPGSGVGDAFWLGRGELALSRGPFKPVVFGDLGWAGSRDAWQHPGRPLAGAGVGGSLFDGILRTDVAKGIRPSGGVRVYLYVDARF
ncbi:MAG: hypothetical protein HOQ12_05230 [Gemmatimonadaceae bacterium]|nr:hypothetical protein [Gemmatimonadaceae bacterium]NUQ93251.1 hypothetical protein [Gemmatimonadaceae bacterium]NUR18916.1 hypothetical protein [Gemmatimonadaceae bacterium]